MQVFFQDAAEKVKQREKEIEEKRHRELEEKKKKLEIEE